MTYLKNRAITKTSNSLCLEGCETKTYYGIKIQETGFLYENKFISTNSSLVEFLICKIRDNSVECVHVEDVVNDFILEHNLV